MAILRHPQGLLFEMFHGQQNPGHSTQRVIKNNGSEIHNKNSIEVIFMKSKSDFQRHKRYTSYVNIKLAHVTLMYLINHSPCIEMVNLVPRAYEEMGIY